MVKNIRTEIYFKRKIIRHYNQPEMQDNDLNKTEAGRFHFFDSLITYKKKKIFAVELNVT